MSPSRVALARVLRAWLDWPGAADNADADWIMYDLGGDLARRGFVCEDDVPTDAGRALLAELDQHEKGGAS